jgi:hypothetical protein
MIRSKEPTIRRSERPTLMCDNVDNKKRAVCNARVVHMSIGTGILIPKRIGIGVTSK